MEMSEILMEINNLKEQITLIDSNLKFNMTIFLTLLAMFLGVSGWALYLTAKNWFDKAIKDSEHKFHSKIEELTVEMTKLQKEIDSKPIKDESGIWSPTVNYDKVHYLNQEGKYYRVGDIVFIWLDMLIESDTLMSFFQVEGLPYIPLNDYNFETYFFSNTDMHLVKASIKNMSNSITFISDINPSLKRLNIKCSFFYKIQ